MRWTEVPAAAWRTPQELVEEGFRRGRVVMLNGFFVMKRGGAYSRP